MAEKVNEAQDRAGDKTEENMARVPKAGRKAVEEMMSFGKNWCVFYSYYCIIKRYMHDS